jgi:hypothetical protein
MPRVDPPRVFLEWLDFEADQSRFEFKENIGSKPAAAGGKFHEPLETA